jgi:anti-sigma B factor antagonist
MSEDALVVFTMNGDVAVATVEIATVLDAVNVNQFGREVLDYVGDHAGVNLLLDFERVEYLSSAVLTELIRIKKAVVETGGDLRLCALSEAIGKVFEITNLDQIFSIEPDLRTALPRFQRSVSVKNESATWNKEHGNP